MSSHQPIVELCRHPECAAPQQLHDRHCLEHLTADEFGAALQRFRAGEPLDARNTTISADRIDRVLHALDHDGERALFPACDFRGATFNGNVGFEHTIFRSHAFFEGATFTGAAVFSGSTFGAAAFQGVSFKGRADFSQVTFNGDAGFSRASFSDYAGFDGATFSGVASFYAVRFSGNTSFSVAVINGRADFIGAAFNGDAQFSSANFNDAADFRDTIFHHRARFSRAAFRGRARFGDAIFDRDADFTGATFEREEPFGPLVVGERLLLDNCVFVQRMRIEVAAIVLSARAATFAAGVLLRVRWAEIALDNADFAGESTLSGADTWPLKRDLSSPRTADDRHIELRARPRLITLRGARVSRLSLSDIDLSACQFFGAHGFDSLNIDASCAWPSTPTKLRGFVERQTIAEEHHWRAGRIQSWNSPFTQTPQWLEDPDGAQVPLQPAQIAPLYRVLRKAREDEKDEAGADDLYYGEMEMRRHGSATASPRARTWALGDRAILHTYWALSGYGLRPVRALVSLTVTLLVGAALLHWFGFHEARNYGRSLLFAIESSLSLLRPPQTGLSAGGEVVQITLRLLGPLLFGLALLAVRARVKR